MSVKDLELYDVPEWARDLPMQPQYRTKLSMKPTPIHRWDLPQLPPEFEVSVKRDDLTGSTLGGSKVRKLDFCLGDAILKKCDCVVTIGGVGSNHARTTALAARHLGIDCHLFLVRKEPPCKAVPAKGNHLLHRLSGAHIHLLSPEVFKRPHSEMNKIVEAFSEKLKSEGHNPYTLALGGASLLGTWAYIDTWQEMIQQRILENFDDVVLTVGTTGSLSGLAIANHLTGSKLRIHGVTIEKDVESCYSTVQGHLGWFGVDRDSRDMVNILGDYIGEEYGKCTDEDLKLIIEVMRRTGVSLDPDYTAKAVKGLLTEMRERPHIFKGKRILFIHTGGIFGLFDGRVEEMVARDNMEDYALAPDL